MSKKNKDGKLGYRYSPVPHHLVTHYMRTGDKPPKQSCIILAYLMHRDKNGYVYASQDKMENDLGIAEKTIRVVIEWLIKNEYITKDSGYMSRKCNKYIVDYDKYRLWSTENSQRLDLPLTAVRFTVDSGKIYRSQRLDLPTSKNNKEKNKNKKSTSGSKNSKIGAASPTPIKEQITTTSTLGDKIIDIKLKDLEQIQNNEDENLDIKTELNNYNTILSPSERQLKLESGFLVELPRAPIPAELAVLPAVPNNALARPVSLNSDLTLSIPSFDRTDSHRLSKALKTVDALQIRQDVEIKNYPDWVSCIRSIQSCFRQRSIPVPIGLEGVLESMALKGIGLHLVEEANYRFFESKSTPSKAYPEGIKFCTLDFWTKCISEELQKNTDTITSNMQYIKRYDMSVEDASAHAIVNQDYFELYLAMKDNLDEYCKNYPTRSKALQTITETFYDMLKDCNRDMEAPKIIEECQRIFFNGLRQNVDQDIMKALQNSMQTAGILDSLIIEAYNLAKAQYEQVLNQEKQRKDDAEKVRLDQIKYEQKQREDTKRIIEEKRDRLALEEKRLARLS